VPDFTKELAITEQHLTNPDGSATKVKLFMAENPKAQLVLFPAMGVFAKYYIPLAEELANNGYSVALADLRGDDTSSVRPKRGVDFSYTDAIHQDLNSVVEFIHTSFPSDPLYLFGHSLGGQLSCLYAAKHPEKVDGLILSATCSVYYRGWNGFAGYRILAGTQFANLVAKTMGYFPGKKIGFGGIEAKSMIRDWSRQSRTGVYKLKNDAFDYESVLRELKKPILSISYEGDSLAPKGAVDHMLGKMSAANSEHLHLSKSDPRNDGYNHFNWAKKPKKLVSVIHDWLQEQGV
jgi:predicted alpha/beta hydrolase